MKGISVVIPNFNGKKLLKENLPFLLSALQTSGIADYEIIVADDASTDESIDFLKEQYPFVKIIQNAINKGFAGNSNSGIKAATKSLVFILNSDVTLTDNYFTPLLEFFEFPETFGVMGRIVSMDGSTIQDAAKYPKYSFTKISSTTNYLCKDKNTLFSFFMSGANALIDRQKLLEIGGFNETFNPYYYEDVDLGLTAWRAGYKIYYCHNAVCKHPNSATIKKQPSEKVMVIAKRNKIILHYLHLKPFEFSVFLSKFAFKAFFKKSDYKALALFLKSLGSIRETKKNYQKYRKFSLSETTTFIRKSIKDCSIQKF
jgi:GT2 family glycosyltransferase